MSTTAKEISVTFAGIDRLGTVPGWARELDVSRSTVSDLCKAARFPGVTVVHSSRPKKVIETMDQFSKLFERFVLTADLSARLILSFSKTASNEVLELAPVLAKYAGLAARIELALRPNDLQDTIFEAYTKVLAVRREQDPLGAVQSIVNASRSLRGASGRLDAKKIAEAFGISLTELARQIGVTKQRISKTPDTEALQPLLRPYERIARLRTVLPDADFKAWLNTPNDLLEDGEAPIDYLKAGAREPLAAVAENMLTGAST